MPLNLSMYSHAISDTGTPAPSYADTLKNAEGIKLSRLQNQAAQTSLDDADTAKKKKMVHEAMESMAGMSPEQRRAAYPQVQESLIKSGALKPEQAMPELDENLFQTSWGQIQKTPEYVARQQEMAKTKHLLAQAEAIGPDTERQRRLAEAQINHFNAQAEKDRREAKNPISDGQKAVDKDYAKDYNNFTQKGALNAKRSIEKLSELAKELEGDTGFLQSGGGRASGLPDALRSRDAIRRRDSAVSYANSTLKELFGGQLSDAERESAAREFYNDKLDNTENAKTLRSKIAQLQAGFEQESAKAKHFEKFGSLHGYSGVPGAPNVSFAQQQQQTQPGLGLTEANASNQPPMENQRKVGAKVSGDEVAQYATKHKMKLIDAKNYLKGQGYAVD